MPGHLYAETLLAPGLGVTFQWRYQNDADDLLAILDPESPVYGALRQAIERFENTVFELAALGKPSILIPYPHATNQHQKTNAMALVHAGGAEMVLQEDLTESRLADRLMTYMDDRDALQRIL